MMSSKKESSQNQSFYMAEPKNEEYISSIVNGILDRRLREKSYIDVLPSGGVTSAEYIIYPSGSNYVCMDGHTRRRVKTNTDAYTVMQHGLDSLISGIGGIVDVKAGLYTMTDTPELYRNYTSWTPIHLRGAGMHATKLQLGNNINKDMISFDVSGAGDDGFKKISGMTLDGRKANQTTAGKGIVTANTGGGGKYDLTLKEIFVYRPYDVGFDLDGWGIRMEDCLAEYCGGHGFDLDITQGYFRNLFSAYNVGRGININTVRGIFNGLHAYMNEDTGLYLKGFSSDFVNLISRDNEKVGIYFWIDNCVVDNIQSYTNVTASGSHNEINLYSCNNTPFSNVRVKADAADANDCIEIEASGDVLLNNVICTGSQWNSFDIKAGCTDIYISNCVMDDTFTDAGTRTVLNGLGTNAGVPGVAGDWQTVTVDGIIVRDTTNNKTYIYAGGGWREISAT